MAKNQNGLVDFSKFKVKLKHEDVEIKRLGVTIRVKELTADEMEPVLRLTRDIENPNDVTIEQLAKQAVHFIEGARGEKPSEEWLRALPFAALLELVQKGNELNGLGQPAEQALKKN